MRLLRDPEAEYLRDVAQGVPEYIAAVARDEALERMSRSVAEKLAARKARSPLGPKHTDIAASQNNPFDVVGYGWMRARGD